MRTEIADVVPVCVRVLCGDGENLVADARAARPLHLLNALRFRKLGLPAFFWSLIGTQVALARGEAPRPRHG